MKKIGLLLCSLLISFATLAEGGDTNTFLFLFKQKELKALKLSMKDIEEQFGAFDTKTYGGNSELALIIEVPDGNFDACLMGQFLVRNQKNINVKLEEIAFRMIDLSKTKALKEQFLLSYEESNHKKKDEKKAEHP